MHMVSVLKQEANLSVMHAVIIWSKHWLFIPVSTFQFAWEQNEQKWELHDLLSYFFDLLTLCYDPDSNPHSF